MRIKIRQARNRDLDALVLLLQELFSIEADFAADVERQRRGLKLMLDGCGKHRSVKVAEIDNTVVGMGTIQTLLSTAEGGTVGLVEDLVVTSRYRGQGVGMRLMEAIEIWAHDHGLKRLQLLADRTNFEALDFYHKTQWRPTQLICLRKKEFGN